MAQAQHLPLSSIVVWNKLCSLYFTFSLTDEVSVEVWCGVRPGVVAGGSRLQAEVLGAAAGGADLCNLVRAERAEGRLQAGSAGGAETRAGAGPLFHEGELGVFGNV